MRAGVKEPPCLRIENSFVCRAAVRPHQIPLAGTAMLQSHITELLVAGLVRCPQDDADVHHDVDEQRLWPDERRQITPLLAPQRQSPAGSDENIVQPVFTY